VLPFWAQEVAKAFCATLLPLGAVRWIRSTVGAAMVTATKARRLMMENFILRIGVAYSKDRMNREE